MQHYRLKNLLLPNLLGICFLALFIGLGCWQLQRAHEKQMILTTINHRLHETPITLEKVIDNPSAFKYARVKFEGVVLNQQQFLLDNQYFQHQVGYHVISPMMVSGLKKIILVDRGWIKAPLKRSELPQIIPVTDTINFQGFLTLPQPPLLLNSQNVVDGNAWPFRIQIINYEKIERLLQQPVYPFLILLDNQNAHGYARDWHFVNMLPAKHRAYAFQWFALALTLLILLAVLNYKLIKR